MIRIAIVTLALSVLGTAQAKLFGGDGDRKATTKLLLDEGQGYKMLGAVCVQYGQPTWKPEYDAQVEKAKGHSHRLGKDFWTTLHTTAPITIAGNSIAAGSYYLGARCDEKGSFHLLVIDSRTADSKSWTPWATDQWKPDHTCALTHTTTKTTVEKLTISLEGEEPSAMELKITWGGHVFTAPVTMSTGTATKAKDAAGKAGDKAKTEAAETKK